MHCTLCKEYFSLCTQLFVLTEQASGRSVWVGMVNYAHVFLNCSLSLVLEKANFRFDTGGVEQNFAALIEHI